MANSRDAIYASYADLPADLKQAVMAQAGARYSRDAAGMDAQLMQNGALAAQAMRAAGINMGGAPANETMEGLDWIDNAVARAGGPSAQAAPSSARGAKQGGSANIPLPPERPAAANGQTNGSASASGPQPYGAYAAEQGAQRDGAPVASPTAVAAAPAPTPQAGGIRDFIASLFGIPTDGSPPPQIAGPVGAKPPAQVATPASLPPTNASPPAAVQPPAPADEEVGPLTSAARGYAPVVMQALRDAAGAVSNQVGRVKDSIVNPADAVMRAGRTGDEVLNRGLEQGQQAASNVGQTLARNLGVQADPQQAETARNRFRERNARNAREKQPMSDKAPPKQNAVKGDDNIDTYIDNFMATMRGVDDARDKANERGRAGR